MSTLAEPGPRTKNVELTGSVFANQRFGGVSKYITELAKALHRIDGTCVSIGAPLHINHYLHQSATELKHHGVFLRRRFRGLTAVNRFVASLFSVRRDCDVLHLTYYDDLPGRREIPRVCTFYDMIHERYFPDDPLCVRKLACFKASERCIAISESTKRDMHEIWGADPDRIDVAPLASGLSAVPNESNGAKGRPYLLWVGNRSSYKNFHRTAEAIARTRAWGDGCELVLAGGPLPSEREKQDWQSVGLDPTRVRFERPTDETLATLYANAMMLLYTSSYEGFGIPPLEAMQCRCPVIAADRSSVPEVVGEAGILIDPDAADSITVAIDRLASDLALRESLITAGLERAEQFTWDNCARKTAETYERTTVRSPVPLRQ